MFINFHSHAFCLTFQDSFPLRFKGMHAVNEPSIIGMIFTIIKPFLKEKTLKRVSTAAVNYKFLLNVLPKQIRLTIITQSE